MIKGFKDKSYEERLKDLDRHLREDRIAVFKYLKVCHKEEEKHLFSIAAKRRMQTNGLKF